jgi:putative photosynthetic complex assembly protein
MTAHAPLPRTSAPDIHSHHMPVPRGPLLAAAVLIIATLVGVATIRVTGVDVSTRSMAAVVAQRALHFQDQADGSVLVLEARPGQAPLALQVVEPGAGGFLRGALRALVRQRRAAGLGAEAPFVLMARADGRLTLVDPATTERVDLESFGPTNAAVFAQLLAAPRPVASR